MNEAKLMAENKAMREDLENLYDVVISMVDVLGLLTPDKKNILPEIVSKEKSVIPIIMKSVMDIITLMGQSQVPVLGKRAEKQLEEKFAFLQKVLPLIDKQHEYRRK